MSQLLKLPIDQRLVLQSVSWQQYEILLATLGERPNLRISYLEGALEMMTTSPEHEALKKIIAMLLEAYFQETRTRFQFGAVMAFRDRVRQS
jgi:Uma2 family endonuclease